MSKRKKDRSHKLKAYKARAKQNAQLERMGYFQSFNGISFVELTEGAFEMLTTRLEGFGNELGEGQRAALYELLGCYTKMSQGVRHGRYAFPLSTGLGKTQSIVAWIASLHALGINHVSVAVCQTKVEALCDLKKDLIEAGVPAEKIGLLHTYKHDPEKAGERGYASLPATEDNDTKPYLLCTHNRVMGKGGVEQFNTFNGKDRNLLIWDESLIKSEGRSLSLLEMESAYGSYKPYLKLKADPTARELMKFFETALTLIEDELEDQRVCPEDREPMPVRLLQFMPDKVEKFLSLLGSGTTVAPLRELLEMSQKGDLRVVYTGQRKGGVIQYDLVVPSCLKNIIILDASYPIRELMKMDHTIEKVGKASMGVVDYSQVTINQLRSNAGRESIHSALSVSREKRLICKDIAHVVQNEIPQDEGVILFNFKERPYNGKPFSFEGTLKGDLKAMGIDLAEKLPNGKDKYVWLTWGNETSLSKYSYCSNVILVGVLHRSYVDLSASIAGQSEDLLTQINNTQIGSVLEGELAHSIYQAISRGRCRTLSGSKANPTQAWIIYKHTSIQERVNWVMPGVNWVEWEPKYSAPRVKGKIETTATEIADYLSSIDVDMVSIVSLKRELSLEDMPNQTFRESRDDALKELSGVWRMSGRSFVRCESKHTS